MKKTMEEGKEQQELFKKEFSKFPEYFESK